MIKLSKGFKLEFFNNVKKEKRCESRKKYHNVVVKGKGSELHIACQHLEFCNSKFDSIYPLAILILQE
jgi:hypothetical protein